MGSIRSKEIKRASKEIAKRLPGAATPDFNSNKEMIRDIVVDKKQRNAVAGYLVRVARNAQRETS
ncbi:30S ribosomal protein S17e [archaeon]|nr:30S ribosomal protein S17e [archaeon]